MVIPPSGKPPVTGADGVTTLPGGGTIVTAYGIIVEAPSGTTIDGDGVILIGYGGGKINYGVLKLNIKEDAAIIPDYGAPLGFTVVSYLPFYDVGVYDWYYEYVMFAYAHILFRGTSDTAFSPDEPMTRAMFAMVLANLEGVNLAPYSTSRFSDVPYGEWYTAAVEWAADKGLVKGVGNGMFDPDSPITREQMALMLFNYIAYKNLAVQAGYVDTFADEYAISEWAFEAVKTVQYMGIVSGKPGNMFDPQGLATRAEVATIFMRFSGFAGAT